MPPRFLYFDLGNVLLKFDHHLAARQMGELAAAPPERVYQIVFESGLEVRYESGQLDDRQFYEAFCTQTGSQPDFKALLLAASEIFAPNFSIFPVVAGLHG